MYVKTVLKGNRRLAIQNMCPIVQNYCKVFLETGIH